MLDVVQGAGLRNVLVVVTRYFGGTLLGTGGLVRAYSQAVQEGLANSVLIDEICGVRLLIETDYNGIGKIQYLLGQRGIPILESEYTDQVKIRVLVPKTEVDRLCAEITEGTNGKAKLEKEEELYFAQNDGELIFGDALTQYKNLEAEQFSIKEDATWGFPENLKKRAERSALWHHRLDAQQSHTSPRLQMHRKNGKRWDIGWILRPNCYAEHGIGISAAPEECGKELTEYYVSERMTV